MKKVIAVVLLIFCQNVFAGDTHAQKAKALGFNGYTWLAALGSDYKEIGGKKLQGMMILVDRDCGANFKAIQRIDQYVLFAPCCLRNSSCSGYEKVVVLPAKGVTYNRGDFIDENSYYVFVGVLKGESMDGFPTQVLAVKQVK